MTPAPRAPRAVASRPRFAVIDIGTNSLKLIVASVTNGRVEDRHFARVPTRLGRGIAATGRIGADAATQTADGVAFLAAEARAHGAQDTIAVGTYALRTAKNGRAVARAIEKRAGVPVRVISGNLEAKYVLAAVRARIRRLRPRVMAVDIGGGSAQLIVARGTRTLLVRSVPLGAVVLTERFLTRDPIDPVEYAHMGSAIETVMARLFAKLPRRSPAGVDMVISGGAATTAAVLTGARPGASAHTVTVAALEKLQARCLAATIEERLAFAGMPPDRADILPAGLSVLLAFAHHAHKRSVKIAEGGWREGVILERSQRAARSRTKTRSTVRAPGAARRGR